MEILEDQEIVDVLESEEIRMLHNLIANKEEMENLKRQLSFIS